MIKRKSQEQKTMERLDQLMRKMASKETYKEYSTARKAYVKEKGLN